jgi:hypothetical protein
MTTVDITHAYAATNNSQKRPVPAQFDTVLINEEATGLKVGVQGRRIGCIRLIFSLPPKVTAYLYPSKVMLRPHFPTTNIYLLELRKAISQDHAHFSAQDFVKMFIDM